MVEEFDAWLCRPVNLDRILPFAARWSRARET